MNKNTEFATKKQLLKAVEEEDYSWLGDQFWFAFALLPTTSKIRKYHVEIWNSLTQNQKDYCEQY